MTKGRTIRTPENRCPHCDYMLDSCTATEPLDSPSEGDLTVCINCGGFLEIRADWTTEALNPNTLTEIASEDPQLYAHLIEFQAVVRSTKKSRPTGSDKPCIQEGDRHE